MPRMRTTFHIIKPCPHQLCPIQFPPTPHKASDIRKLLGVKHALTLFLEVPIAPTSLTSRHTSPANVYAMDIPQTQARKRGKTTPHHYSLQTHQYPQPTHTPQPNYTYRPQRSPQQRVRSIPHSLPPSHIQSLPSGQPKNSPETHPHSIYTRPHAN